jgi:hypothetical protein
MEREQRGLKLRAQGVLIYYCAALSLDNLDLGPFDGETRVDRRNIDFFGDPSQKLTHQVFIDGSL